MSFRIRAKNFSGYRFSTGMDFRIAGRATERGPQVTPTEEVQMGAVKELVMTSADATVTLAELQASDVSLVLAASPDGWAWFVAPPGDEYMQEDWIFHALRRGLSPSFDGAVTALADAVVAVLPDSKFAVAFRRRSGT